MPITVTQAGKSTGVGATTITSTSAGDTLIVCSTYTGNSLGFVPGVPTATGATFVQIGSSLTPGVPSLRSSMSVYAAWNVSAGITSITYTAGHAQDGHHIYDAALLSTISSSTDGVSSSSASVTPAAIITTVDGDLIFVFSMDGTSGTFTQGSGWTLGYSTIAGSGSIGQQAEEYQVQSTHGSITPAWAATPSGTGGSYCFALKPLVVASGNNYPGMPVFFMGSKS